MSRFIVFFKHFQFFFLFFFFFLAKMYRGGHEWEHIG